MWKDERQRETEKEENIWGKGISKTRFKGEMVKEGRGRDETGGEGMKREVRERTRARDGNERRATPNRKSKRRQCLTLQFRR